MRLMRRTKVTCSLLALGLIMGSCGGGGRNAIPVPQFLRAVSPQGSANLFARTTSGGVVVAADLLRARCSHILTIGVKRGSSQHTYSDTWQSIATTSPVRILMWIGLNDIVVLRTTSSVTKVSWVIHGSLTDHMTPRQGWAVLVGPKLPEQTNFLTLREGTITAYNAKAVVSSISVDNADVVPPPGVGLGGKQLAPCH